MNLYSQRHLVRLVSAILVERINFLTPRGGLSKICALIKRRLHRMQGKDQKLSTGELSIIEQEFVKTFYLLPAYFFFYFKIFI